jgi:DNA-binding MarR family transcriptional regulator
VSLGSSIIRPHARPHNGLHYERTSHSVSPNVAEFKQFDAAIGYATIAADEGFAMSTRPRDRAAMDDAKAILNRVRQLVRALRAFDKKAQARFGFGAAQMFILHVLHHDDDLTLNELADRTATDQSSASLAVGKLVAEGYIRRAPGEDRRQVRLSLTPKGRAIVRKAPPAAQERIMESVQNMPPAERAQLMALLDKLMEGMLPPDDGTAPMLFQEEAERPKKRAGSGAKRSRTQDRR